MSFGPLADHTSPEPISPAGGGEEDTLNSWISRWISQSKLLKFSMHPKGRMKPRHKQRPPCRSLKSIPEGTLHTFSNYLRILQCRFVANLGPKGSRFVFHGLQNPYSAQTRPPESLSSSRNCHSQNCPGFRRRNPFSGPHGPGLPKITRNHADLRPFRSPRSSFVHLTRPLAFPES